MPKDHPTTILLADDHPIFRKGLRDLIRADETLSIVAEAEDGGAAMKQILNLRPDVSILDVDMPVMDGLEIAKRCRDQALATRIIFLTMYKEEDMFNSAMDLGVLGYILKENATGDILQGIRAVREDKHYISPNISEYLISRADRVKTFVKRHPSLNDLTPAERRILKLVSESKSSIQIAEILHVSEKTVENHRANIANKLNLHGSHSLLKFALENRSHL